MKELTKEIGDSIISNIGSGAPYHIVAEAHGIREKTLHAWIDQGIEQSENGQDTTPLADFAIRLRKAELSLIKRTLLKVRKQPKAWKNHAWVLEHAYPRYYGSSTMELQAIHEKLQTMQEFIAGQNQLKILHKPVVSLVDDEVNCLNDTQGEDNHDKG